MIIPYKEEENFIDLAQSVGLFSLKITRVKGNTTSKVKRSLLAFSRLEQEPIVDELTIETDRHKYTVAYTELTKDFYLNF